MKDITCKRNWSAWELYTLEASNFIRAMSLCQTFAALSAIRESNDVNFIKRSLQALSQELDELSLIFKELRCNAASIQCEAAVASLENTDSPVFWENLSRLINEIVPRFRDEMESQYLYYLENEESKWFEKEKIGNWSEILNKFPEFREDFEQACECMAFGVYTAAVFHFMRIMEIGVAKCGDALSVSTERDSNGMRLTWQVITNNMNDKIKTFKANDHNKFTEWNGILVALNAVGNAWRNPTMHPKKTYTKEEAKRIILACEGFILDLSKQV